MAKNQKGGHSKAPKPEWDIDGLVCKFGNVSIGPERCSIGVQVERDRVPTSKLERAVVGARLQALLVQDAQAAKDTPGQGKLPGMDTAKAKLESVADCPSLGISPKRYGFRLTFSVEEVAPADIAKLAQREGYVCLQRVGNAGDHDDDDGNGEGQAAEP